VLERRRSLRYPDYDYSQPGAYFVTICVQGSRHLFGHVDHGEVRLTPAGQMVRATLLGLPEHIGTPAVDTFIVMPNHVHALLFLGIDPSAASVLLGDVVSRFKSLTTTRYTAGVKTAGWPRFDLRLWQRNFHDHIIRSDREIERIREYIEGNPARWQERQSGGTRNQS
jgi:REP element-mobilizing transposase RayT